MYLDEKKKLLNNFFCVFAILFSVEIKTEEREKKKNNFRMCSLKCCCGTFIHTFDESCFASNVHICINERRKKKYFFFIVRYMYATCTRKTREKTLCNNPHLIHSNHKNSLFK